MQDGKKWSSYVQHVINETWSNVKQLQDDHNDTTNAYKKIQGKGSTWGSSPLNLVMQYHNEGSCKTTIKRKSTKEQIG